MTTEGRGGGGDYTARQMASRMHLGTAVVTAAHSTTQR